MAGFLRAILIAILAMASMVIFFNMAYFFPWYLTMVETGFAVSQMIATDNYLTWHNYDSTVTNLRAAPIYNKVDESKIDIEAVHDNGDDAIERVYHSPDEYYYDIAPKPYVQMGELVRVTVYASYPFQMTLFGEPLDLLDLDFSFSMNTTTTKHYKDLDYHYIMDTTIPFEFDDAFYWEPDPD